MQWRDGSWPDSSGFGVNQAGGCGQYCARGDGQERHELADNKEGFASPFGRTIGQDGPK
jgi:hypothetical protein